MEILKTLLFLLFFILSGCTLNKIPSPKDRFYTITSLIKNKQLKYEIIKTNIFDIFTVHPVKLKCTCIKIYIEGDGLAWLDSYTVSDNPTPVNPVGFKLFLTDNSQCKIYLARPCQYLSYKNCSNEYWTNKRFSPEIIKTYQNVLDQIKNKYHIQKFVLIGFSGGGAVASILAAKRKDVQTLITVAGNLNTKFWCEYHKISYLRGSLNPVDFSSNLEKIVQYHFVGGNDKIMPKDIYDSYIKNFSNQQNIHLILVPAVTHTKGWVNIWKKFLENKKNSIAICSFK